MKMKLFRVKMCRSIGDFIRLYPNFKGKHTLTKILLERFCRKPGINTIIQLKHFPFVRLSCDLIDHIPWQIFVYGSYIKERNVEEALLEEAKNCKIIFDIGANIGYYTCQFAKIIEGDGNVFAFEPLSYQWQKLNENIKLNNLNNVIPDKKIVSNNTERQRVYYTDEKNSGKSSIGIHSDHYEDVDSTTIDLIVEAHEINSIDLVKIDVEGHEFNVLKGAKESLRNGIIKTFFVELDDEHLQNQNSSSKEVCEYLERYGYKPYHLDGNEARSFEELNKTNLIKFKK